MKRYMLAACLVIITSQSQAGWFDWFGDDAESEAQEQAGQTTTGAAASTTVAAAASTAASAMGLIPSLTENLQVTEGQAAGGTGALLQMAQSSLSGDDFSALTEYLPESDTLMKAAPMLGGTDSAMGSMLKTVGQYSESAKMAGQVASQFEALGLDPAMVGKYIVQIQQFLESSGGKTAVDLFSKGVATLV